MPKYLFSSIFDFVERFGTDEACREFLVRTLWNGRPKCPHCKCREIYTYKTRPVYRCCRCDRQFRVTTGTIFEDSKLPLTKWFMAFKLMVCFKKGISSIELSKILHITQKSAWYLEQKIRTVMGNKKYVDMLGGTVEVDETYVGGRIKGGKRGRGTEKTKVFGILEREGTLQMYIVDKVNARTLQGIIYDNVEIGSAIMSDEWKAYNGLNEFYAHNIINHGRRHYADGEVHVNTLEGAWGHFKRTLKGIYHRPSKKYMAKYCGEFMFRYNNRNKSMQVLFKDALKQTKIRVTHKEITS